MYYVQGWDCGYVFHGHNEYNKRTYIRCLSIAYFEFTKSQRQLKKIIREAKKRSSYSITVFEDLEPIIEYKNVNSIFANLALITDYNVDNIELNNKINKKWRIKK